MVGSHRKPSTEFHKLKLHSQEVPLGSALLFNGKCNHRGKTNNSNRNRPCIYNVYHKTILVFLLVLGIFQSKIVHFFFL